MHNLLNFIFPYNDISQDSLYKNELEYVKQCETGTLFDGSRVACTTPKVSIVIPVYNKVKYLDLALRSAQNQTMRDLEIVCVDDGSTDGSIQKIESCIKDDHRIRLVKHANNEGTLKARYDGVLAAKGEFIMQMDPDDALASPKIAELAYNKAKEVGAEIVHFNAINERINKTVKSYHYGNPKKFNTLIDSNLWERFMKKEISCHIWGKLINRDLYIKSMERVGGCLLRKHIVCWEDHMACFAIFQIAKNYFGLDCMGYLYKQNRDASTYKVFVREKGKFLFPEKANKRLADFTIAFKRKLELTNLKDYEILAQSLLDYFKWVTVDGIMISDHTDEIKHLCSVFLTKDSVSKETKKNLNLIIDKINKKQHKFLYLHY